MNLIQSIYMTILDEPGITARQLADKFGYPRAGQIEDKFREIEKRYGLLCEDDNGGLSVYETL